MRDIPLNAMRAYALIYAKGGIRPAARALGISHSSVSRHLHELEQWIGTDLIDRDKGVRQPTFTSEGVQLGEAVNRCFTDLAGVVTTLRESRRRNSVVVDTTPSFATRWLLPRLSDFEAYAPWVELSVIVDQRLRSPGESGRDISIRMGSGSWSDGYAIPLMSDRLTPVASPLYWRKNGKPKSPKDLVGHHLLHDRDPNASWSMWRDQFGPLELNIRQGPRFGSSDLIIRAAEQGLGVALASTRLAQDSLDAGLLETAFEDKYLTLATAYWIVTRGHDQSKAVKAFISWLMNVANVGGFPDQCTTA